MTSSASGRRGVLERVRRRKRSVSSTAAATPVATHPPEVELHGAAFGVDVAPGVRLQGTHASAAGEGSTSAPTVVFCHCWTGRRQFWHATARVLVDRGLDVVVLDHRGHGDSPLGDEPILIETLSADLDVVLTQLGLERVVLVGHSEGGAIAAHRASTGDERVVGLVIAASAARFVSGRLRALRPAARRVIGSRAVERLMATRLGRPLVRPTLGRRPDPAAVDATIDAYRGTPRRSVAAHFEAVVQFDLRDDLGRIRVPTAVAVGDRDRLTPPRRAREIADGVAGAVLVGADGAGHMLPLERPDELADLISALVDEVH